MACWIEDRDLFDMWFARHFLLHVLPVGPLLNLMDDHFSHYQPAAIPNVEEKGDTLPTHTSHLTKPLDNGCFGRLKVNWHKCWAQL